jgi:hypothetical protein
MLFVDIMSVVRWEGLFERGNLFAHNLDVGKGTARSYSTFVLEKMLEFVCLSF